jgi:hypothetical protein
MAVFLIQHIKQVFLKVAVRPLVLERRLAMQIPLGPRAIIRLLTILPVIRLVFLAALVLMVRALVR